MESFTRWNASSRTVALKHEMNSLHCVLVGSKIPLDVAFVRVWNGILIYLVDRLFNRNRRISKSAKTTGMVRKVKQNVKTWFV
jgi:hypothetical protein